MAKQRGLLLLEGSIGNITCYKTKHGYLAKEKTVISKERQAKDPAYQRTRENNQEFGTASKGSKLIRMAFRELLANTADKQVSVRLVKALMALIQQDYINPRGKRQLLHSQSGLLEGFEFNENRSLRNVFHAPFEVDVDSFTGEAVLEVPSFLPELQLARPAAATHFKLVMGGGEINFAEQRYRVETKSSGYLPYRGETGMQRFTVSLPVDNNQPLIVVFGVQFYHEVNGVYYLLKNGEFNTLGIVGVG
jgi:hypothetical protein